MNVLEFLTKSGVTESKGDARRFIKANSMSIDMVKIVDEKADIDVDPTKDFESIDAVSWIGKWLKLNETWKEDFVTPDIVLVRLMKHFGLQNMKEFRAVIKGDEIFGSLLKNIFIVEKGKWNFFIVRLKESNGIKPGI